MHEFEPVPADRAPMTGPVDVLPHRAGTPVTAYVAGGFLVVDLILASILLVLVGR